MIAWGYQIGVKANETQPSNVNDFADKILAGMDFACF